MLLLSRIPGDMASVKSGVQSPGKGAGAVLFPVVRTEVHRTPP